MSQPRENINLIFFLLPGLVAIKKSPPNIHFTVSQSLSQVKY